MKEVILINGLDRSFIRLTREKKTFISVAVVIVIGTLISGAISVVLGIANTSENIRQQVPPIVTIERLFRLNMDSNEATQEANSVYRALLHEAGNLPQVERFEYHTWLQLPALYLRWYVGNWDREAAWRMTIPPPGEGFDIFDVRGFSHPEIIYITSGELELVAGRTFTEQEITPPTVVGFSSVAVISRSLAERNNLWVGDTFTLSVTTDDQRQIEGRIDFEFEIIGLRDYVNRPELDWEHAYVWFENYIFVPNWIANTINYYLMTHSSWWGGDSWLILNPHFILSDPREIPKFLNELEEIFSHLPQEMIFNDFSRRFEPILHATDAILDIFTIGLIGGIVSAIVLITLLNIVLVNDRRYETGIYLAMGEKKSKLLIQLLTEQLVISMLALTVSLFIGNIISERLSTAMVRNEMLAFDEQRHWYYTLPTNLENFFGYHPLTHEDLIQSFDVSLNFETVMIFYTTSFIIIAVSTVIPMILMLRCNPKKILM